jgi:hypothetical protein
LVAWFGGRFWEGHLGHGNLALKIGAVFAPASVAALAYWAVAWWLGVPSAGEIGKLLTGWRRRVS